MSIFPDILGYRLNAISNGDNINNRMKENIKRSCIGRFIFTQKVVDSLNTRAVVAMTMSQTMVTMSMVTD